ncbi:MAG: ABC transporter permease [Gammaproteobacteria bacterium]|nr:MAG: ABC transporter permease [Gammaproteobacteria bacterium]
MLLMVKGAWNYKHFVYSSIKSEINGRFSRSRLGGAWLILHPLAQALVLAFVLSKLLGARLSGIESDYAYAVYLLSGLLGWNVFAETTGNTIAMFRDRANLLKKISFPRVCIPLIVFGTSLVNHLILLVITLGIVWGLGIAPAESLLVIPLLILVNMGLAMGLGLVLSVFEVFVRDVGHFWQIIIQFWFWLTPIVYVADTLPQPVQTVLSYNPMYWVTNGYQQAIAYGSFPDLQPFAVVAASAAVLLGLGFFLFMRASSDIVDAL